MDPERRYSDEEVAQILDEATHAQRERGATPGGAAGMSLAELEEIAGEVGIPVEHVRTAAAKLDTGGAAASAERSVLGTTIGVGHTVKLTRLPTDAEWGELVADLRITFDARGRVREEGPLRQWTNGNLQALLEPTSDGAQLRLRTLKSDGAVSVALGWSMIAAAIAFFVVQVVSGILGDPGTIEMLLLLLAGGGVGTAVNRARLEGWAETRRDQMEAVADRQLARMARSDTTERIGEGNERPRLEEGEPTSDADGTRD